MKCVRPFLRQIADCASEVVAVKAMAERLYESAAKTYMQPTAVDCFLFGCMCLPSTLCYFFQRHKRLVSDELWMHHIRISYQLTAIRAIRFIL